MKRLTTALTALAGALGLAAGTAAAEPLKIGISAEPYPPFTYKSAEGDWTGFEVELADAICAEMDRACTITPTGWGGIIPALNSGKIDVIMNSMSITAKRDEVIDFSDPYYYTRGAFVAANDAEIAEIPGDLEGMIMGVQGATTHANYARQELRGTVSRIQQYDKQEQANRDLLAGRVDVILADEIAMSAFVGREDVTSVEIKAKAPKHPAFGEGIGIGVREDDDQLTQDLNAAIETVLDNGTCTELSQKYFGTDICGA
jgi:polar amino acid transport system substrate-binding protein